MPLKNFIHESWPVEVRSSDIIFLSLHNLITIAFLYRYRGNISFIILVFWMYYYDM